MSSRRSFICSTGIKRHPHRWLRGCFGFHDVAAPHRLAQGRMNSVEPPVHVERRWQVDEGRDLLRRAFVTVAEREEQLVAWAETSNRSLESFEHPFPIQLFVG